MSVTRLGLKTPNAAALVGLATVLGCGDGSEPPQSTGADTDTGIATVTASTSGTPETDTGSDSDAGTDTDGCPPSRTCGEECCDEGQTCEDGQCVVTCEDGRDPCGAQQACCVGDDVCWLGACVTPGAACEVSGCATQPVVSSCSDTDICEPNIGRCVPNEGVGACVFQPESVFEPTPAFTWGQRRVRSCTGDADCQTAEVCNAGTCEVTWTHREPTVLPDHVQVMAVPAIMDLDQDCVPEIVFNTYSASGGIGDAVLRAIRGDDGTPLWTVDDAQYRVDGGSSIAAGDLDGDGSVELVVKGDGDFLVAIGSDGTPLWRSDPFTSNSARGSAAIANLDGEGSAEIAYGRAVYDASGVLVWEGGAGTGLNGGGPISCVADLDGDDRPELIAGNTAYTFTGTMAQGDFSGSVLWQASTDGDGFCGIADFTADGSPEVVLVASGTISILDASDGSVIADIALPGGGSGGSPNIADFDGDGVPDIGTAGAANYVVVGYDGDDTLEVFWQAQTEDDSSNRTGSSVFDFDGDGRTEVIYNDEEYLRIYPGIEPDCTLNPPGPDCDGMMTDAEVVFRDLSTSRTDTEYPVVADVDGDFKAELVIINNNEAGHLDPDLVADAGIEVWNDELDNWVGTRPVWNQHSYHITNVGLLGEIPEIEAPSWSTPAGDPTNSYRRNAQGELGALCAPDLIPIDLEVDPLSCPSLSLSAFVLNQGCLGVGPGVDVAFYEESMGLLGVTQTTAPLPAGGSERVTLDVELQSGGPYQITVSVDDDGTGSGELNECVEDNNTSEPVTACGAVG